MSEQITSLEQCEKHGEIELGRGQIISQIDINASPGDYPIYSSSSVGEGVFGRYGKYMFEEELITWSIDGGGRPFHRSKHKYSVTNVCGFLRIKDPSKWNYKYVHALLEKQHNELKFDYQLKAHPSVIKKIYKLRKIPLLEQRAIAHILDTIDEAIATTTAHIDKLKLAKAGLLHDLLTRGIDNNGELRDPTRHPKQFKDSDLGLIPKDWDVVPIEILLEGRPKNGYSPKEVNEFTGILMLGLGCLTLEGFQPCQLKNAPVNDPKVPSYLLDEGDFLISRSNTRELVALVGVFENIGISTIYPDLMMRLTPSQRVSNFFLEILLRHDHVRRQLTSAAQGTSGSMVKINSNTVLQSIAAVPATDEQTKILNLLDIHKNRIRVKEDRLQKLKLLKQGLMSDLLTGRVRVQVDSSEAG